MTNERAIEILNPEHREHYPSIEPVNEACRMGMEALEYRIPKKPTTDIINRGIDISGEYDIDSNYICPNCKSVVGVFENEEHWYDFCPNCGQALDWRTESDQSEK
ncbi:MAG: hypothetical protein ACLUFN_07600 [Eubacterium sp.]